MTAQPEMPSITLARQRRVLGIRVDDVTLDEAIRRIARVLQFALLAAGTSAGDWLRGKRTA